jgi:hypothetical protein
MNKWQECMTVWRSPNMWYSEKNVRKTSVKFNIDSVLKGAVGGADPLFICCWRYISDNRSVNFNVNFGDIM